MLAEEVLNSKGDKPVVVCTGGSPNLIKYYILYILPMYVSCYILYMFTLSDYHSH